MELNKNIPPFYVGQEVEAVRDHHNGYYLKGDRVIIGELTSCGDCDAFAPKNNIRSIDKCPNCELYAFHAHFVCSDFISIEVDAEFVEIKEELVCAN